MQGQYRLSSEDVRGAARFIRIPVTVRSATITVLIYVSLLCITGCKTLVGEVAARKDIAQTLKIQADAWNEGDIEGFMGSYWKSQLLTFSSGGSVQRGWQATLDNYKQRYPDGSMGHLKFDSLEIDELAPGLALVLGRFHLDRGAEDVVGAFTLVMRKMTGRWVIIHDHTSRDQPRDNN